MIKSLVIVFISLMDSTMTIDSHNYHFIFDYFFAVTKSLVLAQDHKDSADLVLNIIDALM